MLITFQCFVKLWSTGINIKISCCCCRIDTRVRKKYTYVSDRVGRIAAIGRDDPGCIHSNEL